MSLWWSHCILFIFTVEALHNYNILVGENDVEDNFLGSGYTVSRVQGLYSLSGKTSYQKVSWSLKAT